MLAIIVLALSIIIPLILIIVFWNKFLDLMKAKPYIAALLVGSFVGIVACEIYGWKTIKSLENSLTDTIVTTFTDRFKNSKKKVKLPEQINAQVFEQDILAFMKRNTLRKLRYRKYSKLSKVEKNQLKEKLTQDFEENKNSLLTYYKKKNNHYILKSELSKNDRSKILDVLRKAKYLRENNSRIIYALITQRSITTAEKKYDMGWPWRRQVYGKMISFLNQCGVKVNVFDIIFSEKSVYYAKKEFDEEGLFEPENDDAYFAQAAKLSDNTIVGFTLDKKKTKIKHTKEIKRYAIPLVKKNTSVSFPHYRGITPPYQDYLSNVKYIGSINATGDFDGIFRRTPLLLEYDKKYYPSLAFASYLAYIDYDKTKDKISLENNTLIVKTDKINQKIPLDNNGLLRIKYYGWAAKLGTSYDDIYSIIHILTFQQKVKSLYNTYKKSFIDSNPLNLNKENELYQDFEKYQMTLNAVISKLGKKKAAQFRLSHYEKQIITADLKGKIVMFASIAPALLDLRDNPFLDNDAGAHIHASALDNLIKGDFLVEIPRIYTLMIIFLISVGTAFLTMGSSLTKSALSWIVVSAVIILAGILLFTSGNIIFDILIPLLAVFVVFLTDTIIHYLVEQKEKGFIKGAFGQYLSPKVIEIIMNDPSKLSLGGQRKIITAFFSDVAGFSTISEKLTPDELVALLNDYLTDMCDIAAKYDGTVDKFEGDAIIAFWGAPLDEPEHAKLSCYTSIEMQVRLAEMRKEWAAAGRDPLIANMTMRIGLNSGPAVIGNMGSKTRMDYTMMGDTVNLAARLEGANKFYGTHSMISDSTYQMAKDSIDVRELDKIQVVGKKVAIVVHELLAKKGETTGSIAGGVEQYLKAMELYKQQKFVEAIPAFELVYKHIPDDPPAKTYIERCKVFKDDPPGDDWDGRYVLTAKG